MGLLHRRTPLYGRPLPFLLGTVVGAALLLWGLGWQWNWSLQTGNVFLLLILPKSIVPSDPMRLLGLVAGLASLSWGTTVGLRHQAAHLQDRRDGVTGWRRATFRFYPMTALFGVFLFVFGAAFVFDASLFGDDAPGGYAAFVYLDYAGLFHRPVASVLGILVLALGFSCTTTLAFERGDGVVPWPSSPTTPSRPEPTPPSMPGVAGPQRIPRVTAPARAINDPFMVPARMAAPRVREPVAAARAPANAPTRAVGPLPRPSRTPLRGTTSRARSLPRSPTRRPWAVPDAEDED